MHHENSVQFLVWLCFHQKCLIIIIICFLSRFCDWIELLCIHLMYVCLSWRIYFVVHYFHNGSLINHFFLLYQKNISFSSLEKIDVISFSTFMSHRLLPPSFDKILLSFLWCWWYFLVNVIFGIHFFLSTIIHKEMVETKINYKMIFVCLFVVFPQQISLENKTKKKKFIETYFITFWWFFAWFADKIITW